MIINIYQDKKGSLNLIARTMMFVFIFLIFLIFIPMIWDASLIMNVSCAENFTFECFVNIATLPLIGVVVIFMLIKYLQGGT